MLLNVVQKHTKTHKDIIDDSFLIFSVTVVIIMVASWCFLFIHHLNLRYLNKDIENFSIKLYSSENDGIALQPKLLVEMLVF